MCDTAAEHESEEHESDAHYPCGAGTASSAARLTASHSCQVRRRSSVTWNAMS